MRARVAALPDGLVMTLGTIVVVALVYSLVWIAGTAWKIKANWGEINTSEMNAAIHSDDCRAAPRWMVWPFDRDWDYRCGPDLAGDYTDYWVDDKAVIGQTAPGKP